MTGSCGYMLIYPSLDAALTGRIFLSGPRGHRTTRQAIARQPGQNECHKQENWIYAICSRLNPSRDC